VRLPRYVGQARRRALARVRNVRHQAGKTLGADRVRGPRIDSPCERHEVTVIPLRSDASGFTPRTDPHGRRTVIPQSCLYLVKREQV
jgi:hypothetical protein